MLHSIYFNHSNVSKKLFTISEEKDNVLIDIKCNFIHINQISDFKKFVKENNFNYKKIKILTSLIWINMSPLHEYPLSNFLFNFGKFNLQLNL